jgi:hypothetical protein
MDSLRSSFLLHLPKMTLGAKDAETEERRLGCVYTTEANLLTFCVNRSGMRIGGRFYAFEDWLGEYDQQQLDLKLKVLLGLM